MFNIDDYKEYEQLQFVWHGLEESEHRIRTIEEIMPVARLINKLPIGEENAKHLNELASEQGITPREYQHILNDTRKLGFIVCSSNNGIFLPNTENEIKAFYYTNFKRAIDILTMLRTTRQHLKRRGLLNG